MELIRGLHNLRAQHYGCVATMGNFDGFHRGHQLLLSSLVQQAHALKLPSLVIIFEPQPAEYFASIEAPSRLLNLSEKLVFLKNTAVDRVLCIRFNAQIAQLAALDFIKHILVERLGIRWLIVGDDFRFGHQRLGDFKLLQELGQYYDFMVVRMDALVYAGQRVSSTRLRTALQQEDWLTVQHLLGRNYSMSGRVRRGDQRGRQLGFPTANIAIQRRNSPLQGVYLVSVKGIRAQALIGVANIGTRPTVDGTKLSLEVHILDFNEDIYGQHIQVEFIVKIRTEQRFASLIELKQQIAQDIITARRYWQPLSLNQ